MKCYICGESNWVDINTGFYYNSPTLIFSEKYKADITLVCLNCDTIRIVILNKFPQEKFVEIEK